MSLYSFSDFYPMNLQNLSWDMSTTGSEECLENMALLDKKPFMLPEDEFSDEIIESVFQENPFTEASNALSKNRKIVFQNKNRKINMQNWSEKMRKLIDKPSIIRSAPSSKGTYWNSVDNGEAHSLPSIGYGRSDAIKRISADIAAALINRQIGRDYLFVDARFGYEYEGGHIKGAINVNDDQKMRELLRSPKILIFYCEFSSCRGPTLARNLRNADRQLNEYPKLSCPEIYVLEGGYSSFYGKFSQYCDPISYVTMHDSRYTKECAEEYRKKKLRRE